MDSIKTYESQDFLHQTYKYLKENYDQELLEEFQVQLKIVEKDIIEKLISSIIKEQLLDIIEINDVIFKRNQVEQLLECQIPFNFKNGENNLKIKNLKSEDQSECFLLILNIESINKLNRLKLVNYPYIILDKQKDNEINKKEITNPLDLIDLIIEYGNFNDNYIGIFKKDLVSSISNLTLSFLFTNKRTKKLLKEANENGCKDVLEYVNFKAFQDPAFDINVFYEQILVGGHSYYPFTKTKIGFTTDDVLKYCSEFSNSFNIQFIAIHKSSLHYSSSKLMKEADLNTVLFGYFKSINLKEKVNNYLNDLNLNIFDYQISIIHPHQCSNVVSEVYNDELISKQLIVFPFDGACFTAGLSTRTIFPVENGHGEKLIPCIKSSLSILITTCKRNVSYTNTMLCTIKDELIQTFIKLEPRYLNNSLILNELFSLGFHPKTENTIKRKSINTIFRLNPNNHLVDSHHVIVSCSFIEKSPITSKSLLWEIINKYEQYLKCISGTEKEFACVKWLKIYVSMVSRPVLKLFCKYGFLLEAHQQNTLWLVNSQTGQLNKVIFRDWDGITIIKERLERHQTELGPIRLTKFKSLEECRKRLFHRLFINNISEVVLYLSLDFNIDENILWYEIKSIIINIFDEIENDETDIQFKEEIQKDKDFIINSPIISGPALHKTRFTEYLNFKKSSFYYYNNPFYNTQYK